MSRRETAMEYFKNGYNCSQALVMTFQDLIPVEPNLLLKMSSSFGGGMGRLREVCGAVMGESLYNWHVMAKRYSKYLVKKYNL